VTTAVKIDSVLALHAQLNDMLAAVADLFEASSVDYRLAYGTVLGAVRHSSFIPWDFDVDITVPIDQYSHACRLLAHGLPNRYRLLDPRHDPQYEQLFSRVHLAGLHHKFAHIDIFPLVGTFERKSLRSVHMTASKQLRRAFYFKRKARSLLTSESLRRRLIGLGLASCMALLPAKLLIGAFGLLERIAELDPTGSCMNIGGSYGVSECMPVAMFMARADAELNGRIYPVPNPVSDYLSQLYGNFAQTPPPEAVADAFAFFERWYLPALRSVNLQIRM
jgi:lipopolysaccharide cholinephosphotransferase